jgi:hypothetical protein
MLSAGILMLGGGRGVPHASLVVIHYAPRIVQPASHALMTRG